MRDLFAPKVNGHAFLKPLDGPFRWVVGVFSGNGATEIIRRAYAKDLKTFYPIRRNLAGEYTPLWRAYLFVEWRETVTIDLCRTTTHFIKIVSERDENGLQHPVLVRKDAIAESLRLMTQGKFDDVTFQRRAYGKGAIVRVIEGNFIDRKVRLEMNVTPDMTGRTRVKVDIDGIKGTIELHKLAL
jgi:transcription antitermination factor NusG